MASVMNCNDSELDRMNYDVEDEGRAKPRVSNDGAAGIEGSDKVLDVGNGRIIAIDSFSSEQQMRVFSSGAPESSSRVNHSGSVEEMSFDSIGSKEIRVLKELENRPLESENVNAAKSKISQEMEFRVCEIKNGDVTARFGDRGLGDRDSGIGHLEARRVNSGERGYGKLIPRASNSKVHSRNRKVVLLGSKATKGPVEVRKTSASQYDSMLSMFDEFAANGNDGAVLEGLSKQVGYGYQIGDMVWGKVKSHPWWPGHIYNEAFASPSVRRTKSEGFVLVAFFGDSSYGWFDPADLVPFDLNFAEKAQQTNSRTYMKAVEEAVDEASRRCGLGLACRCRNPYNFRPMNGGGYFAVDVVDFEAGGIYSASQIKKARDSFQPREMLAFVKQLALAPTSEDHWSIHFIKNRATTFAYRKAVFEEFDETYAQAFGYQLVRPSDEPREAVTLSSREPSRAPLSGPLVIAEALGEGKSFGKPIKVKDQAKKDRYLFKQRDERNELKSPLIKKRQASSSTQPVYVENSSASAAGDYVVQKRVSAVSIKSEIPAKPEHMGIYAADNASASSLDATGKESVLMSGKTTVAKVSMSRYLTNVNKVESSTGLPVGQNSGTNSDLMEARASIDQGKSDLEMKVSSRSDVVENSSSMRGIDFSGRGLYSGAVDDGSHASGSDVNEGLQKPSSQVVTRWGHDRNCESDAHDLALIDAKLHDGGVNAKKAKVHKRPDGKSSNDTAVISEKKKKKKKKKDLGMEMSPDHIQMHATVGKGGAPVGKFSGKSVQVALAPRDDVQANYQMNDDKISTSFLPDSIGISQIAGIGNNEVEVRELLGDLQALALNHFHGAGRKSAAITRQVFLRFRFLVYPKSLASLPPAENESNEVQASKTSSIIADYDNPPSEDFGYMKPLKVPKPSARHDDPTNGGRKRGPSDRQEEIAERKMKKMNDLKLLATEKRSAQKTLEVQRGDGKEVAAQMQPKAARPEFTMKMEHSARVPDPMMLVMKFPPRGTLPSLPELKAKFARFGQIDHSATRVFWKTSTCRVVFRYKPDAQVAYKFASGSNNLFGNTDVRCHLRELGDPTTESESGKVQKEDTSVGTLPPRIAAAEPRSVLGLAHWPLQQPAIQLKSCLRRSNGDEPGLVTGSNSGCRVTPRVRFMLSGEESSRGEHVMVGNRNLNNNASFADGGASSSSTSLAMDFNSKNFQKVIPASQHILPFPNVQFPLVPYNLHYTEVAPFRNIQNPSDPNIPPATSSASIDIAQQMLSLLTKCNDVVSNVSGLLGYVPYHPI